MVLSGLALVTLLALAGLYFLWKYLFPLPAPVRPSGVHDSYGPTDVILSLLLSYFLMQGAWDAFHQKATVTVEAIIASCVLYAFLIITILGILIGRRRNPISLFGLKWTTWRRNLPGSFFILLSAYPSILLIQLVVQEVYGPEAASQEIVNFLARATAWQDRAILVAMAVIFAPLAEELIFRGFLFGVTRQYLGRWPAVLITSAMFSVMHGHIPALAGLFVLAVVLALIYEKTRSLWAPIAVHSAFNAITVAATILWPSATI